LNFIYNKEFIQKNNFKFNFTCKRWTLRESNLPLLVHSTLHLPSTFMKALNVYNLRLLSLKIHLVAFSSTYDVVLTTTVTTKSSKYHSCCPWKVEHLHANSPMFASWSALRNFSHEIVSLGLDFEDLLSLDYSMRPLL
jgi:hypothetical protein